MRGSRTLDQIWKLEQTNNKLNRRVLESNPSRTRGRRTLICCATHASPISDGKRPFHSLLHRAKPFGGGKVDFSAVAHFVINGASLLLGCVAVELVNGPSAGGGPVYLGVSGGLSSISSSSSSGKGLATPIDTLPSERHRTEHAIS